MRISLRFIALFFLLFFLNGCKSLDLIRYGLEGKDVVQMAAFGSEKADFSQLDKITLKGFSISDFNHPRVKHFLTLYTTSQKQELIAILKKAAKYLPTIQKIFQEKNIPLDLIYLPIIESGYRTHARSHVGAQGIWQFMYNTGRYYKLDRSEWHDDRLDPFKSTTAAAYHFKYLYKEFHNWLLVLAAYNAGAGKIKRAIKNHKTRNFWEMCQYRYLRQETKNYIPKFIAASLIAKNPKRYGLPAVDTQAFIELATHLVEDATDMRLLAECAGISESDFKDYNPALLSWATPPKKSFYINVPTDRLNSFRENLSRIKPEDRITYRTYIPKIGDNLTQIAKRYRVSIRSIAEINAFKSKNSIEAGRAMIIPLRGLDKAADVDKEMTKRSRYVDAKRLEGGYRFLHEVGENEYLYTICKKYGVTIADVKRWNQMRSIYVAPGRLLLIKKQMKK